MKDLQLASLEIGSSPLLLLGIRQEPYFYRATTGEVVEVGGWLQVLFIVIVGRSTGSSVF